MSADGDAPSSSIEYPPDWELDPVADEDRYLPQNVAVLFRAGRQTEDKLFPSVGIVSVRLSDQASLADVFETAQETLRGSPRCRDQ